MKLSIIYENRNRLKWGIALGICSLTLAGAFTFGAWLPTPLALGGIYALCLWGLWHVRTTRGAWLSRLMIVIYTAPFTQAWPLLFRDRAIWWIPSSTNFVNIMLDREVNRSMINLGLLGSVALLAGLYLASACRIRLVSRIPQQPRTPRYLRIWIFLILLAVAMLFSWLDAPPETILTAKTITADGIAHRSNWNSAYLFSYLLLILLWVDTEGIGKTSTKRVRQWILYLSVLFIVFYFQLLRGNRESIGLVFGMAGLYLTEPMYLKRGLQKDKIRRWVVCGITMLLLMVFFVKIQHLRVTYARKNSKTTHRIHAVEKRISENLVILEAKPNGERVVRFFKKTGPFYSEHTWGACLLTNLSMSNQYKRGTLPMEWGRTYWHYVLSLPPGVLTQSLGLKRPMERDHNPAWWFKDISAGGANIVTVPFVNFRAWGVAVLILAYGFLIGWTDRCSRGGWVGRLWYGSFFLVCFQWFWYGDMFFIRGTIAYLLLLGWYAIARQLSWTSHTPAPTDWNHSGVIEE